ncbi:ABC transporter permease subunit [Flavobacterium sp. W21_SRS_FM6]|uniref:ABC transporter permease subunit n=1 Tax=Flavobacterium sp. W21_SRS_FM6 TaxID=3240268 RepID=UPI003F91459D
MATTLRRLAFYSSGLLVMCIAGLPVFGLTLGLWPRVELSWHDVSRFVEYNGLTTSILNSLFLSLAAPVIAWYVAFLVYSQYRFSPAWQSLEKRLSPLLSLPHLAVALGLVYLFSSGGLLWNSIAVPEWLSLPRKSLLTMMLALTIKEVPFFLLIFGALGRQLPIKSWLLQGRALGHSEAASWWLLVFPALLKQSRLALLAAMAYCLSVLDISLLVGPNIPQLYAVVLYHWQTGFSAIEQSQAFIANLVLLLLLGVLVAAIYLHEWLAVKRIHYHGVMAHRLKMANLGRLFSYWLVSFSVLSIAILVTFFLWSVGWNSQSHISSADLSFTLWQAEWFFLQTPLFNSLVIGLISSGVGVGVSLLALELQQQKQTYLPDYLWLMAILLPQLSMVYGWQIAHTAFSGGYGMSWVVLAHVPFTFAYSYLVLRGPFQSIDRRYELLAASFGFSYWQRWWLIRFRLLSPALLSAFAIAFSVSMAQYISTLMIGAGRVVTITTEAVAIASGNEQGITAVYILVQAVLPFMVFLIASIVAHRLRGSVNVTYH